MNTAAVMNQNKDSENESDDDDFTVTVKRKDGSHSTSHSTTSAAQQDLFAMIRRLSAIKHGVHRAHPFARKSTGGASPRPHLATPLARACCPTALGWLKTGGHCIGCPAAKSRRPRLRRYKLRPRPHRYNLRPRSNEN
jgi:hypothetical protein